MLSGYQVQVVAFQDEDNGIFHTWHANDLGYSTLQVERSEAGLDRSLQPIIRFTLDEIVSEQASEYVSQDVDYDEDPDAWNAEYERLTDHGYACDVCGEPIT